MKKALALFLTLTMLLSLCACGILSSPMEYDSWPSDDLAAKLPAPDTEKIKISEYSSFVSIDIYEATAETFTDYISKCETAGFIIEAERGSDKYEAYNAEGCKLEIDFLKNSEKVSIDLNESKVNGTINWPSIGLASLIPVPNSNVGTIASNSSTCFTAYVGETSEEDYRNYVNSCIERGFTVDFSDTGEDFYGNNVEGIELHLAYHGFKTLYIYMEAPEDYGISDEENVSPTEENVGNEENTEKAETTEATKDATDDNSEDNPQDDTLGWPESGLPEIVPKPKGRIDRVSNDSTLYFYAYVTDMTESDYEEYIELCRDYGFTLDEVTWDGYFSAYHESDNGDAVTVTYEDDNTIKIEIFANQNR